MIRIKIPIPEKVSLNKIYAGQHWSKRKELAEVFHRSLIEYRNVKIEEYPLDVSYIFTFKDKTLDCSNTALMAKLLEDGLVAWGVIKGDEIEYIQSVTLISQKGGADEVEIILT